MTAKLLMSLLAFLPVAALGQSGWGQVTLENRTSVTMDLYVDGNYGCRALAGLICTTMVTAGVHNLVGQTTDGRAASQPGVEVASGGTFTWSVSEDVPAQ